MSSVREFMRCAEAVLLAATRFHFPSTASFSSRCPVPARLAMASANPEVMAAINLDEPTITASHSKKVEWVTLPGHWRIWSEEE